jgi:hypothetical protein
MEAHARVTRFWRVQGFQVIERDSAPRKPFSISEARNAAVRLAKTEKVIVADADTLPDIGAVLKALDNERGFTWPFSQYRHIPGSYADKADLMTAPIDQAYKQSTGGIFVCATQDYWDLGGMDERFDRRWGYEDNAFALAARTLSSIHRVEGIVFSFNHAAERDLTAQNPNRARYSLYQYANGKPDAMRELIKR